MSKYLELQTNITEERFLIEALQELGYRPDICPEGRSLIGYRGDERQVLGPVKNRADFADSHRSQ